MRTNWVRPSLLIALLLALIFVATDNAFGQEINPAVFYRIIAQHSGKCLAVAGGDERAKPSVEVVIQANTLKDGAGNLATTPLNVDVHAYEPR